jgi:hypothetical protein
VGAMKQLEGGPNEIYQNACSLYLRVAITPASSACLWFSE